MRTIYQQFGLSRIYNNCEMISIVLFCLGSAEEYGMYFCLYMLFIVYFWSNVIVTNSSIK